MTSRLRSTSASTFDVPSTTTTPETSIRFRVEALDQARLRTMLTAGADARGNPPEYHEVTEAGGTPLRCCLQEAEVGERVALLGWPLDLPDGPYAEVGPVFVHADGCAGYPEPERYPAGFVDQAQVQRAYDPQGRIPDARWVEPGAAEQSLAVFLARPEVAVVHSRNPMHGCYMFAVRRAG